MKRRTPFKKKAVRRTKRDILKEAIIRITDGKLTERQAKQMVRRLDANIIYRIEVTRSPSEFAEKMLIPHDKRDFGIKSEEVVLLGTMFNLYEPYAVMVREKYYDSRNRIFIYIPDENNTLGKSDILIQKMLNL